MQRMPAWRAARMTSVHASTVWFKSIRMLRRFMVSVAGDRAEQCCLPASARAKQHDEYLEVLKELTDLENARLAYVAFTRARHEFVVSSHAWGNTLKPLLPSPYLDVVRRVQ